MEFWRPNSLVAIVVDLLVGSWGHVTGLNMRLARRYFYRADRCSLLSAGCPAPKGFPGVLFPLARMSFAFVGAPSIVSSLTRSCSVWRRDLVLRGSERRRTRRG